MEKNESPVDKVSQNKIVRLSKSCIGSAEKNAVMGVLDRGYLGMGGRSSELRGGANKLFWPTSCLRRHRNCSASTGIGGHWGGQWR